jgi:hypothetical protein
MVLVLGGVMIVAWYLPIGAAVPKQRRTLTPNPAPSFVVRPMARKLTQQEKLAAAVKQLKVKVPPKGLKGFVELSVQKPFVQDAGALEFWAPYELDTKRNVIYGLPEDDDLAPYNLGFVLFVNLQVARPNTPHLLSFYIDSNSDQDFDIEVSNGTQKQTHRMPSGPSVLPYVFIPPAAGDFRIMLRPSTVAYRFSRVEIDVVE